VKSEKDYLLAKYEEIKREANLILEKADEFQQRSVEISRLIVERDHLTNKLARSKAHFNKLKNEFSF